MVDVMVDTVDKVSFWVEKWLRDGGVIMVGGSRNALPPHQRIHSSNSFYPVVDGLVDTVDKVSSWVEKRLRDGEVIMVGGAVEISAPPTIEFTVLIVATQWQMGW